MGAKYNNKYCQEIYRLVEPLLGDVMSQNVIKIQVKKIGKTEDLVISSDLPKLSDGIKTGLVIFLGTQAAEYIAVKITKIV